ncbi:hypothetical protein AYO38_00700 [bacterium SCGC AG-212-C10]|nr:hypothetical protein AYO38_00700 [bacterium SCGC AG-212-C10]
MFTMLPALALLAAACGGDSGLPETKVFQGPVWSGEESLSYILVEKGGEIDGTCVLETHPEFEPGRTKLNQLCGDGGTINGEEKPTLHRDDRTATVDAETLRPISAMRTISDLEKKQSTTFTSTYTNTEVSLEADVNGKLNSAKRTLPAPTEDNPDPGYYDDESLFWVIRGIPLEADWEGAYHDINAGNGRIFNVELRVEGQKRVTVPAGTFDTWEIRLKTNSIVQHFWVEREAPHRVIQAEIERITYKLVDAAGQ